MSEQRAETERTRRFYDRISRAYDVIADSSEHEVRDLGIRALGVCRGQRVLELGCGTGHGLVNLADAVGATGRVYEVDISPGMIAVADARVRSAGLPHVRLTIGDARALCFRSLFFDAAFMSFTLELFDSTMAQVLGEIRRVLRPGGRVGIVAMAETGQTNAMIDLYEWLHRHWPHFVDCRPIDVEGTLQTAGFRTSMVHTTAIWNLRSLRLSESTRPTAQKKIGTHDRSSIRGHDATAQDDRPRSGSPQGVGAGWAAVIRV